MSCIVCPPSSLTQLARHLLPHPVTCFTDIIPLVWTPAWPTYWYIMTSLLWFLIPTRSIFILSSNQWRCYVSVNVDRQTYILPGTDVISVYSIRDCHRQIDNCLAASFHRWRCTIDLGSGSEFELRKTLTRDNKALMSRGGQRSIWEISNGVTRPYHIDLLQLSCFILSDTTDGISRANSKLRISLVRFNVNPYLKHACSSVMKQGEEGVTRFQSLKLNNRTKKQDSSWIFFFTQDELSTWINMDNSNNVPVGN